ncbi:hypothetical protein BD779DRAFT_1575369 [Infundibulicybe gibba]|nr:hypothetical protein BD779DRAFT_1575369 [Infundibulicybe gibba]
MNMIQRGASSPWPPRRSTAGGNKADTAPVTAQYGGPLRKPANDGHAIRETPCRGELSHSAPASHGTRGHGVSSGVTGHTRTRRHPLGCASDCLCVGMYSPPL